MLMIELVLFKARFCILQYFNIAADYVAEKFCFSF